MPRVEYTDPTGVHREVTFKRQLRVGRHPNQDLQILDRVVSKAHAVFEIGDDGVPVVYDAGSRNGTIVNGDVIDGRFAIADGDEVTVGSTVLVFRAEESRSERLKSKVTILEEGFEASVRKRLKETGNRLFLQAEQIDDVGQLRNDYEKLRIANELNQALAEEFDMDELLTRILDKAFEMFGADRGVIMLIDPETGEPEPAAVKAKFENVAGQGIRISRTILSEVMEEKTAVLSSNAQLDERFGGAHSIILQGIKATMSVPLLYREKLLGIIHLDSQMTSGAFTEKDLSLLQGFANQAANAIEHSRVVDRLKQEALAREQLGRLLSPEMVDDVVNGKLEIRRGGAGRIATVLFADIRGFTAMSERQPAQDIVAMLNEYFEIMVEIIFRHGGTLDKFVGDEIMAVWNAPVPIDDHCGRAVRAALDMQRAMIEYNQTRAMEGLEPINTGIGINTGEVVAGFMGSSKAMDHTVIGDVVNTASRLCSKASAGEVIVGPSVVRCLNERIAADAMPPAALKGKAEPVPIFRVKGVQ